MHKSRTIRKRPWKAFFAVRHVVAIVVSLALTAAVTGPATANEPPAAVSDACAAHATSFAVDEADPLTISYGCARDAGDLRSPADSDSDLITAFHFSFPERREQVRDLIEEQVAEANRSPHLGDWLTDHAQRESVGIYPPQDGWLDFDGELHVVDDDTLVMVIPMDEIGTTANWWQKFIAGGVGMAVWFAVTADCVLAFDVGAPAADPVCGAVGAGIGALVGELVQAGFDHSSLGDGDVWAEALAVAFRAAVAGTSGGQLLEWAEVSGGSVVASLQRVLRDTAARLGAWGDPLTFVSDRVIAMWPTVIEKLQLLSRGVGGSDQPLKVMVVGDSMSQGYEGDWTWRYRLWEWFRNQHIDVDFVGPYVGTKSQALPSAPKPPPLQGETPPDEDEPDTTGGYAPDVPESFDTRHFAVWGRQADQDKKLIRKMVSEYRPDMLLVGLGFNDMGWFVSDAAGTLDSVKTLVDEARAAKPDVDFALANVPQRSLIGGREDLPVMTTEYNNLLKNAVPTWNSLTSSVKLVDWAGHYDCGPDACPASYDGLHPNAEGEFQIARAFEYTLTDEYGIGYFVPDVPATIPSRQTDAISGLRAETAPGGIEVTWDKVHGARGYDVRHRRVGSDTWSETRVPAARFDEIWTVDGEEWEYQVRVDNGDSASAWSSVASAVAHPKTAPGPEIFVTLPTKTGIRLSWFPAEGPYTDTIDRYEVIVWDKDTPGAFIESTGVRGESVVVDDLKPGHHYLVAVSTWNDAGGGFPTTGRSVTVGGDTPPAPQDLTIRSVDETTVDLDWQGSEEAAGYRVWVRNLLEEGPFTSDEYVTDSTSRTIAFLFPGYWNFEFCVTAVNGSLESEKSNCVGIPDQPGPGPGPGDGNGNGDTGTGAGPGDGEPSPTARAGVKASAKQEAETLDDLAEARPFPCTSLPASKSATRALASAAAGVC
ncbi:fibronectin type III domain-containing protein [Streptomyces sp. NPDC056061]|uniref:fibronectin type III domain-containing protein n=1 Tax=Streptomyces sp. NPDC056061 TaxID=3345700 RepID=UPI0035D62118